MSNDPGVSAASEEHSSAGTGHDDMTAAEQQAWHDRQKSHADVPIVPSDEANPQGDARRPDAAARYGIEERVGDSLPAHYFDCDRFEVYDHGTRQGKCDCTATADVNRLLDLLAEFRKRDEVATRVIEGARSK